MGKPFDEFGKTDKDDDGEDEQKGRNGGRIIAAIGAQRPVHEERQGLEILRTEKRNDAEIAERKTEAQREHEPDIATHQRIFDANKLGPSRYTETPQELTAA